MIALDSSRPLEGVLRLASFDPRGIDCFNGTKQEARASFIAPLLVFPFAIWMELLDPKWQNHPNGWWQIVPLFAMIYIINLSALFCMTDFMVRGTDKIENLPRFISAYNWATILQTLIYFPIALCYRFSLVNEFVLAPLMGTIAIGLLCYQWFIIKSTLQIPALQAASLIVFDISVGILLNNYIGSFFGAA